MFVDLGVLKVKKWRRSERIGAIISILANQPHQLISLGEFVEEFNCAKSTISEDLAIVRNILQRLCRGKIETVSGAAGGVRYIPYVSAQQSKKWVQELCDTLSDPERILPGGYLYMVDCIYSPELNDKLGELFAARFANELPDLVVTVETKGIPLAMATARYLNVPVVVARRDNRVTEGSSVSINYVSGSTRRIQTMSLARRSMTKGARVLLIDDFMKAGGTIKGLMELMDEFEAEVVGIGVLLSTKEPESKLVQDYISLAVLEDVNEADGRVVVRPSALFR